MISETPSSFDTQYYVKKNGVPDIPGDLSGKLGLCISGGGSRSISAAMGQLRALNRLGMLDREKIKVLSAVSGGGWASILYTYRSADIGIDEFLGEIVEDPGELTVENEGDNARALDYLSENSLGRVPTRVGMLEFLRTMIELYEQYKYPLKDLWVRAVGKLVLEPFGLVKFDENGNPLHYMAYTKEWVKENPLKLNPGVWKEEDFNTVPDDPKRPFLFANTAVYVADNDLYPYEVTPIYNGVYSEYQNEDVFIGGGYVDTHALGSQEAQKKTDSIATVKPIIIRPGLSEAAAFTGAFFTPFFEKIFYESEGDVARFAMLAHTLLDKPDFTSPEHLHKQFKEKKETIQNLCGEVKPGGLIPRFTYFPPGKMDSADENLKAEEVNFSDGGTLENLGITPLLLRNCSRVIVFGNTATPLAETENGIMIDSTFPPLFGFVPKDGDKPYVKYADLSKEQIADLGLENALFTNNQIFPSEEFFVFLEGLAAASRGNSGKLGTDPAIFKQKLTTVENPKFGIRGGHEVTILWIYNNPVESWVNQLDEKLQSMLEPKGLKDKLKDLLDGDHRAFDDFPNYNTVTKFHLHPRQVNMLAHLSTWVVLQNKELFLSMLEDDDESSLGSAEKLPTTGGTIKNAGARGAGGFGQFFSRLFGN